MTKPSRNMEDGDLSGTAELYEAVYKELRSLAARRMAHEASGNTLQPTALAHEAWLRLGGDAQPAWKNRAHFFGAAGEAMRRILVDRARKRNALRRGGGADHVEIDEVQIAAPASDEELIALDEALEAFAKEHAQKAELVNLRFFVGLSLDEAAEVLGISTATADRWWAFSRAWLGRRIRA